MAEMNLPTKQKQTYRYREQTGSQKQGVGVVDGEGLTGVWGLADANYYI